MTHPLIVRAIDVGYGNTKFVVTSNDQGFHCDLFPSLASPASGGDLTAGVLQKRNTVKVDVRGISFEVGKDAEMAVDSSFSRTIDENYPLSDAHLALVRGAMAYMGVTHIDQLVVGLPLLTYAKCRVALMERLKGEHIIPVIKHESSPGAETRAVMVRNVVVFPQPMGGLLDHAHQTERSQEIKRETTLVVDPGFYTLDWLVCKGLKPLEARSGAKAGGISSILQAIASSISEDPKMEGRRVTDLARIDEAIREHRQPKFYGTAVDMTEHLKVGFEKARQLVGSLANKVGNGQDIDNIVLVGGGAALFEGVLKEKYPHHKIEVAQRPVFSNVRGFQLGGLQMIAKSSAGEDNRQKAHQA